MWHLKIITLIFVFSFFHQVNAQQKEYQKDWIAIEQLEIDGKVSSAFDKVTKLLNRAKIAKNNQQIVKCLLFKWKFQQLIDEKSQLSILEEVQTEIKQQDFPNKQLLQMYMAHFLQTHMSNDFWTIKNRTTTENAALKDYRTWDLNTYLKQIAGHYENALKPELNLASIPTSEIAVLLTESLDTRKFKPTLYDVIAYKALDFYSNSRNRVDKPKDEFLIDDASYFSNSSTFIPQKINTTDQESLLFKAIKTYQNLERIHGEQKNEDALIHAILNRLEFVKKNHIGTNTNQLYLQSLQSLHTTFKNNNKIALELAKAYRSLANEKKEDGNYKYPDYNSKALALCSKIEIQKEDSFSAAKAKNLKAEILQKRVEWQTSNTYLPNKSHLAKITFTNAKNFQLKVYQVGFDFNPRNYNYQNRDSLTTAYLNKRKVLFIKNYTLPIKEDYNSYSTEVIVPQLNAGTFYFEIITDGEKDSKKYHKITCSEWSINKTNAPNLAKYQVLDAYTGKPIPDASVEIKKRTRRGGQNEYTSKKLKTDELGVFSYTKNNRYENMEIIVSKNKDTISISDNSYSKDRNFNYAQENNKYKSKTLLFLDRAIYRPKQKVYFKALALAQENQISNMLSNKEIKITVQNTNREKVHETILRTNEYGSVSGNFDLPEEGLNGNFSISADLQHPRNRKYNQNATVSFSVEEYKRPTFEINFDKLTKVYKPLDSIKVTANAKAFLGTSISNAQVSYSVKRTTQHRFWWYFRGRNNESKQITTGSTTTDDQGNFSIPFIAETDTQDTENKIYNYSITAKVTDLNGETREGTTTIKVADKNLIAAITTENNWSSEKENEIKISNSDVNNNPIITNGTLKIYKLESPGRFLNKRPWPVPDIQQISESDFINQFPHVPYSKENEKQHWKKGKLVFEQTFSNISETSITVKNSQKWPQGAYAIVAEVTDPITKATTETQQHITLEHKNQEFPADGTLFIKDVVYDEEKPTKATIKLQTSAPELIVFAEAFDGDNSIWKEKIVLKKGSVTKELKFPKLKYPKVTIQYNYQIFNKFYHHKKVLDFTKKPVLLNIEKKHFLDKISPATKETWSFVVNTSDNSNFNAEALASMYDASLDSFKKSNWSSNFEFGKSYPSPQSTKTLTRVGTKKINYQSEIKSHSFTEATFEKLNFYGFQFNQINSWNYRRYLRKLKNPNELELASINSADRALRGKVSGVQIKSKMANEAATMAPRVTIRGAASVNSSNGPLIIVDGKPIGTGEDILSQIDTNNILDIQVLKDGDPVAIYGSRAANGVIIVKTKTGFNYVPEESPEDLKNIEVRTNLQETAFFLPHLKTNKKGEIKFEFDTPEALTRWNFRMLAHTKNGIAGKLKANTLTQKELNIIPNAPRFVREGDTLRFSSKIANLTDNTLNGTALLELSDPTSNNSINAQLQHLKTTQNFSIDAKGNSSINWKIVIPEGLSAIQYKVVAKAGDFSDGEINIIPVLSNRMLVTENVPMWVRPGETENYTFENFDPNSSTQKAFGITLEYTSNPAWLAIKSLPYLMEFPHQCSEQTFSRLYANSIATHILNSQPKIKAVFESWEAKGSLRSPLETNEELKNILIAESPWLQEAVSETEQQQRLGELFNIAKASRAQEKAINKLRHLQKSSGGFPWFKGGKENPFITRHILAGFGHLEKLNVTNQRSKTDAMVKKMTSFLDNRLINDYNKYLKHHKTPENFYKRVSLLHYAYARSFYLGRFPLKGQPKEIIVKALNYQKENWQMRSIYEKGLLALCLHRFEKSPVAQKILTALTESAVQSKANGMYWKQNQNSWWWHKSEISTQALLIEAFSELKQPKKHIEGLKLYLLKNKRTNRWESTIQTADACYALLLQGNDWLSVKDNTSIKIGSTKIATNKLEETEKEQGTGYLKTRWSEKEITPDFKEISVTNKSEVTGYGGYYWQYFEHLDNIKTDDNNPMSIKKELYKKEITDKGTELKVIDSKTPLKIGDKVTVRLHIKSDDNLEFVHLKDMRAAGFEPTEVLSKYQYKERLRYYQSTKDIATHFFIDYLPKGNYVLEYDVIANQNGSFSNGITQLQCMYAPEFSSHSAGQRVEILE